LDSLKYLERYKVIPFFGIEETMSPTPDVYQLKLEGEEIKFWFGNPSAKASFVEAIL
jgi:hypothetical protein